MTPSILLMIILIIIDLFLLQSIHSMGTLLHAGPSCIIKPQRSNGSSNGNNGVNGVKHRGICYSTLLCKQKGGVAIGRCGLGNSCCVFPQTCNSISVRNSTYFTSPDYPSLMNKSDNEPSSSSSSSSSRFFIQQEDEYSENSLFMDQHPGNPNQNSNQPNQCSLTIHRMPGIHPICKIRLDFIEYEIEGHQSLSSNNNDNNDDDNGNDNQQQCSNKNGGLLDWITIKPIMNQKSNGLLEEDEQDDDIIKPICPTSKIGQHVIIDVRKHIGPFLLTVNSGSYPGRRRWNILINQLECNNHFKQQQQHRRSLLALFPNLDKTGNSNSNSSNNNSSSNNSTSGVAMGNSNDT